MWDVGVPSFTKGARECGIVRRDDHKSPNRKCIRRGDHRSPNKAIRCRAKRDVGVLFRTNEILFILATNGRPYAIILFCHLPSRGA